MNSIGIMQGRLLPPEPGQFQCFPRERWREEFSLAARAGLRYIEWICDGYGADINPLMVEGQIDQIRSLMNSTGVNIKSTCVDYLMEYPLARSPEAQAFLRQLLPRCRTLGMTHLVLPFVDNSAIRPNEFEGVVDLLRQTASLAASLGLELHLETDLPPADFAALLSRLPDVVKVNYDSGNSASLGYAPAKEFAAFGHRIGSVHIKDRVLGGGTVPLGCGSTDFPALFAELHRTNYAGNFILQVARGASGEELDWARKNVEFICRHWALEGG